MLGAGALQTVGLKTITAKHLMLVAQSLQVVILNINTIKNHFELRLTPKQYVMLTQFDQILKVSFSFSFFFFVFPRSILHHCYFFKTGIENLNLLSPYNYFFVWKNKYIWTFWWLGLLSFFIFQGFVTVQIMEFLLFYWYDAVSLIIQIFLESLTFLFLFLFWTSGLQQSSTRIVV